jgi:hypothetical protein
MQAMSGFGQANNGPSSAVEDGLKYASKRHYTSGLN